MKRPVDRQLIEWPRADPEALTKFNSSTKVCVMNCGPHASDPRNQKERKFLCDDCHPGDPLATKL